MVMTDDILRRDESRLPRVRGKGLEKVRPYVRDATYTQKL